MTEQPDPNVSFFGDTTSNNHQIQANAAGEYADLDELRDFENVGPAADYMTEEPGRFRVRTRANYSTAVSRQLPTAGGAVITSPAQVSGWAVRETGGVAPAVVRFRDGVDVGNAILVTLAIPAGGTARDFLSLPLEASRAVFFEVVSGAVEGNLFTVETRAL